LRTQHFEHFAPICPVCRRDRTQSIPLQLQIASGENGWVDEGQMHCSSCRAVYPILHGIPILVSDPASYLSNSLIHVLWDESTSPFMRQWLGESTGPSSAFELTRQYLSTYAWAHYGDMDPDSSTEDSGLIGILEAMETGPDEGGKHLDIGCATGRGTLHQAQKSRQLCLGVDINFSMLRFAQLVARQGRARYGLREVGTVYRWRDYTTDFSGCAHLVDFWAADALALPFDDNAFNSLNSLNVLDCVHRPLDHLAEMVRTQKSTGGFKLVCPYDWSPQASEFDKWIGGHSQMGSLAGSSEDTLRWILSPEGPDSRLHGARITEEVPSLPWRIRVHSRSMMHYEVHMLAAEQSSGETAG
jgi:SAM-dependent methyltransferase/uncharacterized protein YbaR (Trm112 family)